MRIIDNSNQVHVEDFVGWTARVEFRRARAVIYADRLEVAEASVADGPPDEPPAVHLRLAESAWKRWSPGDRSFSVFLPLSAFIDMNYDAWRESATVQYQGVRVTLRRPRVDVADLGVGENQAA